MIHQPPPTPTPQVQKPPISIIVNTVYFEPRGENVLVNLRGINGTAYIDYCQGRQMHFSIAKRPGQEYGTMLLQCKGEKTSKAIYLK